jgi:hypothetical protein
MAQADSVPSSSRQLITGERANQSTSLRAVKLPAVRVRPVDRHYFIGGSDARVITDPSEAFVFWIWRERRPDVEQEDLSNCRWYAASIGQEPLGSNIGVLSFETVGFLLGRLSGTFLSCFGSGAGISAYVSGHSTGCHQTGWSDRSHRGG